MDQIGGFLTKIMNEGGWVMWVLLALLIVGLAFTIERFIVLFRANININEFLSKIRKALLVNNSPAEAIKICEQYRGPIASIMKAGIQKIDRPREDLEKHLEDSALHEMGRLERGLTVLATIANIAPLVGFFGTVIGMIDSFDALAKAGLSDPGLVAEGIKVALYTTAGGLFVAIPIQVAYNYFMSRINRFVREIERSANLLIETSAEMKRTSPGA